MRARSPLVGLLAALGPTLAWGPAAGCASDETKAPSVRDSGPPDSAAPRPDSGAPRPDSGALRPDSGALRPDSGSDSPDTGVTDQRDAAPADETDAARTESRACPGGFEPGPTGLVGLDLARDGFLGDNEITAVFCNSLMFEPQDRLVFYIAIVNHLDGLPRRTDLTSWTFVESSEGLRTEGGFEWDGDALDLEDHHVDGWLSGPRTTADGTELIGPDTEALTLHLRGIGSEDADVVFVWEREFLP